MAMSRSESPQEESPASPIRPGLESCGLCVADTAAVLNRLAAGSSALDVSREIAQGKLLRKRSSSGRRHVLAAVRRRFIEEPAGFPHIDAVSAALRVFTTPVSRSQVLLPYLLASDAGRSRSPRD